MLDPTTLAYYHDGGAAKTQEIEAIWKDGDADGNGALDRDELGKVLRLLQVPDDVAALDQAMIDLDKDGDGNIVFDEFATWYLKRDESAEQIETTVAGLAELAASGKLDDETYVWVEGLGDDWLQYRHAKERLAASQAAAPRVSVLPTAMACYHAEVDGDESGERIETTVAGLAEFAASGTLDDETYVWVEGLGDDWLQYRHAKERLAASQAAAPRVSVLPTAMACYHAEVDGDESGERIETTVAGLVELAASGTLDDETYVWVEGLGDDWLQYSDVKNQLVCGDSSTAPSSQRKDDTKPASAAVTFDVIVPDGVRPGDTITLDLADGREIDVIIPEGHCAGDEFEVELDMSEATTAPTARDDAEDATEGMRDGVKPTPVPGSEPAMLAASVKPQSHTVNVACPEGVGSGETIAIQYENHAFDVQIPAGVSPGEEFEVQIEI
eukprot:COSAG02_NODE_1031_length_15073_cov_13.084279_5_plen_442_part_00